MNGDDARVIALRVERGEIVPLVQAAPDVPREIAGLVHRAMAARPELRFATATEMRLALEKASTAKRPVTGHRAPAAARGAGDGHAEERRRRSSSGGAFARAGTAHAGGRRVRPRARTSSRRSTPSALPPSARR